MVRHGIGSKAKLGCGQLTCRLFLISKVMLGHEAESVAGMDIDLGPLLTLISLAGMDIDLGPLLTLISYVMVDSDIESMDGFSISIVPHPTGSPSLCWECLYTAPSQWLLVSSLEIVYTAPSHWIPISIFPIFILPPPMFPVSILPNPTGSPSLCWNISALHHPTESQSPCCLSL